jgi:dCMP deaminase
MTPCYTCAMLIVGVGIKSVVCEKKYHGGADSEKLFKDAGLSYTVRSEELQQYKNQ